MSKRVLGRTWRDLAQDNQELLVQALTQLQESGVEVAGLRVALMKIEELASRPGLDDRGARVQMWAIAASALRPGT